MLRLLEREQHETMTGGEGAEKNELHVLPWNTGISTVVDIVEESFPARNHFSKSRPCCASCGLGIEVWSHP